MPALAPPSITLSLTNTEGNLTLFWATEGFTIAELHMLLANITDQTPIVKIAITDPTIDVALSGSPQIVFVMLPVAEKTASPTYITVKKPYDAAQYTLTSSDDAGIKNYEIYEVSCYILPDPTDTTYLAA